MFSKKLLIPMMVALSTACSVPVLAANVPNHESRAEVSHIEHSPTMAQPQQNRLSEVTPPRQEHQQFSNPVRQEHQQFSNPVSQQRQQFSNPVRQASQQFSNPHGALNGYHANSNQSQLNPMNNERWGNRHDGNYASYQPVTSYQPVVSYGGWVPAVGSGNVDPRTWERDLEQAIYADRDRGLTSPVQAQFRLNQVMQIREEHQQFLNQNGAPNGNVLSQDQINLIHSQLAEVNIDRMADCGNQGTYLQIL